MARSKRYTDAEISAKLAQAELLAKDGKSQSSIAYALGISVVTFHRWRKTRGHRSANTTSSVDQTERINQLERENFHLRKIVTDLLLRQATLEEKLRYLTTQGLAIQDC
jgi:putative transposase